MKILSTIFLALFIAMGSVANAGPVDVQTAKDIGVKYLNASVGHKAGAGELQLVKTYFMGRGDAAFYVFSTASSFVIVSAQDVATPILGYSDEGPFDANAIPEQMEWWLQDYARQIQYGVEERQINFEKTAKEWDLVKRTGRLSEGKDDPAVVVAPLLDNIKWNQGKYYNDSCPEAPNAPHLGNHTYAGCVACSMSQIMRKWQHPVTGTGSHTSTGKPDTLFVNFGATTYDWANMPEALTDQYNNLLDGVTEAQRRAANQLIYHAGVAVNMRYNTNGSSAYSDDVPLAFLNYFGYSDELELEYLQYTADQIALWKVKLRSSLNHGYPMYYSGATYSQGHAFVCDGYRSDNYFHINWGYSGNNNGYFPIGGLNYNPASQYNGGNDAVFNLHPSGTTTTFTINVASNNEDYGTVTKTGTGVYNSNVTLTATPKSGYHFCYWSVDGVNVSENKTYTFKAKYDQDVIGVFAPPFTVSASSSNLEHGTVSGGGASAYPYGTNCTLTATPAENYAFVNWTKDDVPVSTSASYTFKVTGDGDYVANFLHLDGTHVGSGTSTNVHYPVTGGYKYSLSQQIYTPAQLGTTPVLLGSVAFFNTQGYEKTRNLTIFMKHTDKTIFSNTNDWISVTEEDKVFDGSVQFAASGWTIVDFESLFAYNGTSNVVVVVDDNTGLTAYLTFKVDELGGSNYSSMYWNSETDVNPLNPTTATLRNTCRNEMYVKTYANSTTFTVGASIYPDATGSIDGTGSGMAYGSSCTLIATPEEDYAFECWKDAATGRIVSKDASYTFAVKNNRDLIAVFRHVDAVAFANDEVKAICLSNWDANSDGELSYYEASQVADLGTVFKNNKTITSFDELQYFTRLTTISDNAFNGCENLTSVVLPEDLTSIGISAFQDCPKLESMDIPAGVKNIGNRAFLNCDGLTSMVLPEGLLTIGDEAFSYCEYMTTINIPSTVTTIGSTAFAGCKRLTGSIVLPNSVTTLGSGAFSNCTALNGTLTLSNKLTVISNNAFYNCSGLTGSIIIPEGVTSIGTSAFQDCSGLNGTIIIAESVGTIYSSAFNGCGNVTAMICKRTTPSTVSHENAFSGMTFTIPVYVQNGTIASYSAATGWSQFTNYQAQIITSDWTKPTSSSVICVDNNYSLTGNINVLYVYVPLTSNSLTVTSGYTLTSTMGVGTTQASQLVLNDGAQLIIPQNTGVKATLKKTTAASTAKTTNNWYAIASPVNNVAISSFAQGTHNVYRYDEVESEWEEYRDSHNIFNNLDNGRGYLYRSTTANIEFAGDVNTGKYTYPLTYTTTAGDHKGFHLIGNPYPHIIYKGTGTAVENTYLEDGFYKLKADGTWLASNDNSAAINVNEGILVQAKSTVNGQNLTILDKTASGAKAGNDQIMFTVENADYTDVSYVLFKEGRGLNKVDHRNADIPMLYVVNEGEKFGIADMPDNTSVINLGFEAKTMCQYTLNVKANGMFSYLHLVDKVTGNDIDLLAEPTYSFIGAPTDNANRFTVNLSYNTGDDIFAFQNGDDVIVSGKGELQVFDVTGRLVMRKNINGVETCHVANLQTGVYIFRLNEKSQKILIK